MKISICALALVAAAPALAKKADPSAEAKQLFTDGMARYNVERYDEAIKLFQDAYVLRPDPIFLYNVAQSYRMLGNAPKAIDYYKRYLRGAGSPPNRAEVEARIQELESKQEALALVKDAKPEPAAKPAARPAPKPVPVIEPDSQTAYLSSVVEGEQIYTLVGVGVRKAYGFKVYGMGLYVEDGPARAGAAKAMGDAELAANFVILGDFAKMASLKFVRDVAAKDVIDSYRESIEAELPNPPPALKTSIDTFLGLFLHDMKKGEECVIRTGAKGEISVEIAGKKKVGPTSQPLAQAIWKIWLGKKPVSPDLRKALVSRLDALTK